MSARRARHPRFSGYVCLVDGCGRVDYKHGLCHKHWDEVPLSDRLGIAADVMMAAHRAAGKGDAMARRWAQNYAMGTAAARGK